MNSSKLNACSYVRFKTQCATEAYYNELSSCLFQNIEMFMQNSYPQSIVWQLNEVEIQKNVKEPRFVQSVSVSENELHFLCSRNLCPLYKIYGNSL